MKNIIVLGGGGFIGGHLAKKMKELGNRVVIGDIEYNKYFELNQICDEFILCDLRDIEAVKSIISFNCDEVYQLAADMGGAGYINTGQNDADVMHNSAIINLNVAQVCVSNKVKKVFYSSSACIYPEYNQLDPDNPNCLESSAYPALPDSEYGWEKLFSERMYLAFKKNYQLDVRIARFHNIFGTHGTWNGGKEKAPAAMLRKAAETKEFSSFEVWGDGIQTRSFLYISECIEAILKLMDSDFEGPVNIGSEEKISINDLAKMAIEISQKNISSYNIYGNEFIAKYGFKCPQGVRGRNSDNTLFEEKLGWKVSKPLYAGMVETYKWIKEQVDNSSANI